MICRTALLLAIACGLCSAQPAFEVASIKPSGPQSQRGSEGGPGTKDPGRYSFHSATLFDLLVTGYKVENFQISSKLPLDRDLFDLDVRVPQGATRPEFLLMLQRLLAERFHLTLHTVRREFNAYVLVVAKSGAKLKESSAGPAAPAPAAKPAVADGFPDLPPNRPGFVTKNSFSGGASLIRMKAQQEPMPLLAQALRAPDDPPIVDQTGLTGKYDFKLEYTRDLPNAPAPETPASVPNLFTALQEQLGLQLLKKKIPFDVLIIESFDRIPTGN